MNLILSTAVVGLLIILLFTRGSAFDTWLTHTRSFLRYLLTPLARVLIFFGVTANMLTSIRGILPLGVLLWMSLVFRPDLYFMAMSGVFLAFTDTLDGLIANLKRQISNYGKTADPVADKLFFFTYTVVLIGSATWTQTAISALLILNYAIFIWTFGMLLFFGMRMSFDELTQKFEANHFGKAKMTVQVLAIANIYYLRLAGPTALTSEELSIPLLALGIGFEVKSQWEKYLKVFNTNAGKKKLAA